MTLQVADSQGGVRLAEGARALDAAELAQLMSVFNDVTSRLHETHDRLHREVHRLRSELADANDQLQRSRRLAALGQMAAGIAHEVRNPLGSIRLYARMLEDDLADRPDQGAVAAKIAEAVGGLDAVVGDVLTFARELVLRPALADASDLLRGACDAALPDAGAIEVDAPWTRADPPVTLRCDPHLIRQALVNLIRNAAEAMGQAGGEGHVLTLSAAPRPDPDREDRELVVLGVADTGPGMDPGVVDRMFNPFFTTRHTGTGLGLAIVHRIVDAHAGRIVVRSRTEPGEDVDSQPRGTTVELHLPSTGAEAEHHSRHPAPGAHAPDDTTDPARTAGDDVQEARR